MEINYNYLQAALSLALLSTAAFALLYSKRVNKNARRESEEQDRLRRESLESRMVDFDDLTPENTQWKFDETPQDPFIEIKSSRQL